MCAGKKWLKAHIRTHVGQLLLAQTGGCHSVNTSAAQVSSRQRERRGGFKRACCAWRDTYKSSACISALVINAGSRRTGAGALRYCLRSCKNVVRNNNDAAAHENAINVNVRWEKMAQSSYQNARRPIASGSNWLGLSLCKHFCSASEFEATRAQRRGSNERAVLGGIHTRVQPVIRHSSCMLGQEWQASQIHAGDTTTLCALLSNALFRCGDAAGAAPREQRVGNGWAAPLRRAGGVHKMQRGCVPRVPGNKELWEAWRVTTPGACGTGNVGRNLRRCLVLMNEPEAFTDWGAYWPLSYSRISAGVR
jgi:hypothetical protein